MRRPAAGLLAEEYCPILVRLIILALAAQQSLALFAMLLIS